MTYLDRLKDRIAEKGIPDLPLKPPKPGLGGLSGNPRGRISGNDALRQWHAGFALLDPCRPLGGIEMARWQQLYDDAAWLLGGFGQQAAHDAWSTLDLFGIHLTRPGWGGLCDRLGGARNLKMDADRAVWSLMNFRESFCRGGGDDLRSSGLVPIWEMQK